MCDETIRSTKTTMMFVYDRLGGIVANPTITQHSNSHSFDDCHARILATKSSRYTSFGDESPIAAMVLTILCRKLMPSWGGGLAGWLIRAGHVLIAS
ncbi:MAG TPA: hypothetical protein DEF45_26240 [Rhodopirellula sp.]|nr:hypothetical protein [Rhodopirellula sp.]